MAEEEKLFYTIGEVAQIIDVKPYVLRYWETEFRKLNPQKSVTGQRAYRARDVQIASTIKRLLYGEKFTIAGAVQKLQELEAKGALDPFPGQEGKTPPAPVQAGLHAATLQVETHGMGGVADPPQAHVFERPQEKVRELISLISRTKEILKKYQFGGR